MESYEYKVIKVETSGVFGGNVDAGSVESMLNGYGAQGWKVVGCIDTNQAQGSSKFIVYTLMRESR